MQSQVNEIDPVTVELEIVVPWQRVEAGLALGYGKLQKSAKVPGFRPGRVPRSVVKRLFGAEVRHEVTADLVQEGIVSAVEKHELPIVASPNIDKLPTITKGEALNFKATVEVRPKVEEIKVSGIELSRPAANVSDADVDKALDELRERHAEIITPDPMRPSQSGDLLTINYKVSVDGEEKPEMAADDRQVELGSDRLLTEFNEGLMGLSPEEETEFSVAYDDESPNEELRGKSLLFKVKLVELRSRLLPELDDEFAKEQGEHDSIDSLRAHTRQGLEDAAAEQSLSTLREQAIDKLVEANPIPVPPSLIRQQEESMQQEMAYFAQITGQPLSESMTAGMSERAENKVRAGLLMGELARIESIEVSDDEYDAKLAEVAESTGKHIAKVRVDHAGEKGEGVRNKLLEDKLIEYILGQAQITDAPAEQSADK